MNKNIWLSIDFDYLNYSKDVLKDFYLITDIIPKSIPCIITVEHHHVIKHLEKMIRDKKLQTPLDIIHIDEHHDHYFNSNRGRELDCGNLFWHLIDYYRSFKWFQPQLPESTDWSRAKQELSDNGIKVITTKKPPWNANIHWDKVGLVTFTVSPDYSIYHVLDNMEKMISIIENDFDLKTYMVRNYSYPIENIHGWRLITKTRKKVYG